MSLDRGTKLALCEILEPIGAGGTGEAYKALKTHLNRGLTGRRALCSSSRRETAPKDDPLTSLLNCFDQLRQRMLARGK